MQTTQQGIAQRNASLDEMFAAVREEHRLLGVHIAAGKVRLAELREQAEGLRGNVGNDPGRVQELADLDAMVANLAGSTHLVTCCHSLPLRTATRICTRLAAICSLRWI